MSPMVLAVWKCCPTVARAPQASALKFATAGLPRGSPPGRSQVGLRYRQPGVDWGSHKGHHRMLKALGIGPLVKKSNRTRSWLVLLSHFYTLPKNTDQTRCREQNPRRNHSWFIVCFGCTRTMAYPYFAFCYWDCKCRSELLTSLNRPCRFVTRVGRQFFSSNGRFFQDLWSSRGC
jgi:hypothetical protein